MTDKTIRNVTPGPFAKILRDLNDLSILFLCIATIMSWLGRFWWVGDLCSHFTLYFVVSAVVLLVVVIAQRRRRAVVVVLMVLVLNVWPVLPIFWPCSKHLSASISEVRLAQVNILHKNRDRDRALEFFRSCDADVMFVQEIDPWWANVILESDVPYRFEVSRPADGSFGIAMLVHESVGEDGRVVIESTRVIDFADGVDGAERPAIEATLLLNGQRVKLLSIHPPPPVSAGLTELRDSIIRQAKDWADEQTVPHVIIGDLNTTPWSYAFSILDGDGKLVNTLDGRGNQGSWPTHLPLPWLLPIDHCLHSEEWVCLERGTGPEVGSDHLPLLVVLGLQGK